MRKLHHNKIPTDEQLLVRCFRIVSKCSNCNCRAEDTKYLFFNYVFACKFWSWICHIYIYRLLLQKFIFGSSLTKRPLLWVCLRLLSHIFLDWMGFGLLEVIFLITTRLHFSTLLVRLWRLRWSFPALLPCFPFVIVCLIF